MRRFFSEEEKMAKKPSRDRENDRITDVANIIQAIKAKLDISAGKRLTVIFQKNDTEFQGELFCENEKLIVKISEPSKYFKKLRYPRSYDISRKLKTIFGNTIELYPKSGLKGWTNAQIQIVDE